MTAFIDVLRSIANGTPDNPMKEDPAAELQRIDAIVMDAIAKHEADGNEPVAYKTPYFETDNKGRLAPVIIGADFVHDAMKRDWQPLYAMPASVAGTGTEFSITIPDSRYFLEMIKTDSLAAIVEVIGSPRAYSDGKQSMRQWFLDRLRKDMEAGQ